MRVPSIALLFIAGILSPTLAVNYTFYYGDKNCNKNPGSGVESIQLHNPGLACTDILPSKRNLGVYSISLDAGGTSDCLGK